METQTPTSLPGALFNPLAGWEAAAQWNAAAYEWMTQGWQQWWSLMTAPFDVEGVHPARANADAPGSRVRANDERPQAAGTARPKRSARPKKAGAKSRVKG